MHKPKVGQGRDPHRPWKQTEEHKAREPYYLEYGIVWQLGKGEGVSSLSRWAYPLGSTDSGARGAAKEGLQWHPLNDIAQSSKDFWQGWGTA